MAQRTFWPYYTRPVHPAGIEGLDITAGIPYHLGGRSVVEHFLFHRVSLVHISNAGAPRVPR